MLNLAAENTLKEWMRCVAKAQTDDGVIPGVVPTAGWCYSGLRGPLWDAVCVNVPYYVYKYSADIGILRESSDMIYKYLCNIETMRDGRGIVDYGLTDWNQPDRLSSKPDAPRSVTDTAQCIEIARLAEEIFRIIGDGVRANYANELYASLRRSFRENLIDFDTMTVLGSCQTSQTLGIAFGLFEEKELPMAKKMLLRFIEEKGCHIATGMLGIRYIFHVLCDMGEAELAMKMICSTDRIGYGYWIKSGYDTLWETFARPEGPHVSKNHHYFGDISSIFVQRIAGIQPNPHANDLSKFVIAPEFSCGLDFAEATYESIHGRVFSRWSRIDMKRFTIKVFAPCEIHGEIKLPRGYLFEDGEGVKPLLSGKYGIRKIL
jgi:alpha-L-rhamnosidase